MSPKQYLPSRRMHLARRALRDSAPDRTTVTEIATRYGFWHFGRFAGEYQIPLRGSAVHRTPLPSGVATERHINITSAFLPKVNSALI